MPFSAVNSRPYHSSAALAAWRQQLLHTRGNVIPGPLVLGKILSIFPKHTHGPRNRDRMSHTTFLNPAPRTTLNRRTADTLGDLAFHPPGVDEPTSGCQNTRLYGLFWAHQPVIARAYPLFKSKSVGAMAGPHPTREPPEITTDRLFRPLCCSTCWSRHQAGLWAPL